MNDADVSKQIQQMVRFIRQEAEEKANEISVSAEEVTPDRSISSFSQFSPSFTLDRWFVYTVSFSSSSFFCRNSTSRSCSWLKPTRRRSAKNTSANRSKLKFARRCNFLTLYSLYIYIFEITCHLYTDFSYWWWISTLILNFIHSNSFDPSV